jgi:HAD superfamily hydrolase (TIGR01549 family)
VPPLSAVSLDFFNTLVHHKGGRGRGGLITEYFRLQGWASDPWRHSVFGDLFAQHGAAFDPDATRADHRAFCTRVARTLFDLLRVQADPALADVHASALWDIVGPANLAVFPEVAETLRRLRASGYRLLIISNWDHSLPGFCRALGLAEHFDTIVVSAEVGVEKPDRRIFHAACARLDLPVERVLHVGDSVGDDVDGARQAGLPALLLDREHVGADVPGTVRTLADVVTVLETASRQAEGSARESSRFEA